uniref:thiol-disulfide oxidoreductase DCC family protein n=1 Tax=Ornithobacterium rhinotracheale TaxID=28251 RepID=UPI0039A55753
MQITIKISFNFARKNFLMAERIIFFDGVCNLCDEFVQLVLKRDEGKVFKFSSLQSNFARKKLAELGENAQNLNTIFYLKDEKLFNQSQAVLEIAKDLGYPY